MIAAAHQRNAGFLKLFVLLFMSFLYNSSYLLLINLNFKSLAGYFALLGQVSLDVVISIFAFQLYKKTQEENLKLMYMFFWLSALAAIIADGIYHIAMNILDQRYFNEANSFFEIPFILFLFFQVLGWGTIFFSNNKAERKKIPYFPYATVSLFIFFTFTYSIPWKIHYLSRLGIYQSIDTILEVIGFSLAAICLARSKNNPIRLMAIGYLFVISSDLLIRYHVISGIIPALSFFETTWIIGLLLMVMGFYSAKKGDPSGLLPINSLQSYVAIWLLNFILVFLALFFCINYFFPNKEISHYLLWIITPFAVFAIIGSKYFATKILAPLARLEIIIKDFLSSEDRAQSVIRKRTPIEIEDLNLLEQFVYDAFDVYEKKHHLEMEYIKMATQVAHDIQSPILALNTFFKDAVQLDKAKFDRVKFSLQRINEIANNLLIQYKQPERSIQKNNGIELIAPILKLLIEEKKLEFKQSLVKINLIIENLAESAQVMLNIENFRRTISNLVNNAVNSIKEEGTITISLQKRNHSLILVIADTGTGIPESILKNINENKIQPGNGLGLPFALQNIKAWGADFKIESEVNQGTSFQIIFPWTANHSL